MTTPRSAGAARQVRVSIVVPTTGQQPLLERCLEAVLEQPLDEAEVIVVHGGPGTPAAAERPGVRVVDLEENLGFGAAANAGAAAARGRYLVFLNDDVELEQGWLEQMLACLERHPRAASACGKLLRPDGRTLDGAGDGITRALKAYRRGQGLIDSSRFELEEEVFSASGTACIWRKEAFAGLGGFDVDYFAYYEDVDLGFRARLAGYESWYEPAAVALHHGAATSGSSWPEFESFHSVRNRWLTILRNVPRDWIARDLPWILLGEIVSLGRATAAGELRLCLRAYADAVRVWRRDAARPAAAPETLRRMRSLSDRRFPPLATSWWRFRAGNRLRAATTQAHDRVMLSGKV